GLLDHEEAVAGADLAVAAAHLAGARARPGLGAGALARLAARGGVDLQLDLAAVKGVLQPDFEIVAQIGAAPHVAAPALLAAHELAEDIVENVGEGAEILPARMAATHAVLERG